MPSSTKEPTMQTENPNQDQSQETANNETEAMDSMPSIEQSLKQAELLAQEHHDAWLRAKAEADNIRKRAQSDVANAHKYAIEGFASELLAVKDSLEAALSTESPSMENLKNGVELTLKQLSSAFEKFNLNEINPVNEKFDPHKHQAISMVESAAEANTVVAVLQKGYQLHERIVRPALVTVSKAK
ncbi:nucleotide exchange factor GrpE [Sulfuriferula sp. AH1]|uniref:nucleotide exchange factor GrpE n=1 Tax=Sulfuriferula sp. AH1 TaxID=1985873 RepID=UPI0021009855|nr:nucleotide exchange factor GrpE [Sulfuriferula sp. AH1]